MNISYCRGFSIAAFKKAKIESLNAITLFSAVVLTALYFFTANSIAMSNYSKTSLLKSAENIRMEIRNLNIELTGKRSISFLKEAARGLNLVINENIQYIKVVSPVASNSLAP